ncbi:MAG: hypothetical protein GY801_35565 [bacterium]|nr:hypothetical protein [bacterium]
MMLEKTITMLLAPWMNSVRLFIEKKNRLSLNASLWGVEVNEQGHLVIGGCDCVELASEYGTPVHIVDRELLQRNYQDFYESFAAQHIHTEVYYSYKTSQVPGIIRELHADGAGAEVISPYELWLALKLGVDPASIIYNGPNKSTEGLRTAVEKNIKLININSFNEIQTLQRIAEELQVQVRVGVRVNLQVGWGENQFGFSVGSGKALEAFKALKMIDAITVETIHAHLGTNIISPQTYENAIEEIGDFMGVLNQQERIVIKSLDLGGGFGVSTVRGFRKIEFNFNRSFHIPYLAPKVGEVTDKVTFAKRIVKALQKKCDEYGLEFPTLLFEPGRALTSNAQILLAKVDDIKETRTGKIAILDAGINLAFLVPLEYHEIFVANNMNAEYKERYDIVGPICTPGDVLYKAKTLPRLNVGDLVAIMDAGAYFTSFSNNFSFPRPAVVMVSDTQHGVVRKREQYEDMVRLDTYFQKT